MKRKGIGWDKYDISNLESWIKNPELKRKLETLVIKSDLKAEQDETVNLQASDSICFQGKCHFEEDITQNYSYFKTVVNTSKYNGMSDESIKPLLTSDDFDNARMRVKLLKNYLKKEKVTFTYKQIMSTYIAYEINLWPFTVGQDFTQGNSCFEAVKLTINADLISKNILAKAFDMMWFDNSLSL